MLPAVTVYNDGSVGTAATVEVKALTAVFTVTGGATTTLTFADADTDIMSEFVTKINAIAGGDWIAALQGDGTVDTDDLITKGPTGAYGVGNELTLYYVATNLLERVIEAASDQVESWLDRKFASQDFSEIGSYSRHNGYIQLKNPHVTAVDFFSVELEDGLTVQYTGADPVATVEVRGDSVNIRSRASDTPTETEKTLTDATDDTITELVATLGAVAGWTATVRNTGPSQYLDERPAQDATTAVTLEAWVPFDDDYILHAEEGILEIGSAFHGFTTTPARYRCDYTGGYATVPYDVEQVVIELAAEMFRGGRLDTNLKSERLGDYAYQLATASERKGNWMERLSAHRKMVI